MNPQATEKSKKPLMVKWKRDVIYGIALELVCLFLYLGTRGMPAGTSKIWQTRPDVYTWLWLIILAILSLILIIKAVIQKDETPCEPIWSRAGVFTAIVLVVYLFAMDAVGFIPTTILFLWGTIVYYSWKMEKLNCTGAVRTRKIALYLIVALIGTFVTYWIFTSLLSVRLPGGKLF